VPPPLEELAPGRLAACHFTENGPSCLTGQRGSPPGLARPGHRPPCATMEEMAPLRGEGHVL